MVKQLQENQCFEFRLRADFSGSPPTKDAHISAVPVHTGIASDIKLYCDDCSLIKGFF